MIQDVALQFGQMLLVLGLAPLLTGLIRKFKARLQQRRGPPLLQPYRDLWKLLRKEAVIADNASWLFRVSPYLIFSATWAAASLVPTFATGLTLSVSADLIAIVALLGSARFFLALVGLDIGTSFGGIGSSREVMIASLAEPALIIVAFTLALIAGSTQLSVIAAFMTSGNAGLRVSLGLALVALIIVAIAENCADPGRQSRNASRTDDGPRSDGARILRQTPCGHRICRIAQAIAVHLVDRGRFFAVGTRDTRLGAEPVCNRHCRLSGEGHPRRSVACSIRNDCCEDARVPCARVPGYFADARVARRAADVRDAQPMTDTLIYDVAHLLAGGMVLVSFMLLYQDRMSALLNVFALHAAVLSMSVAWQAYGQNAPHLYVTAFIAVALKAILIPSALRRIVRQLDIHREIETAVGIGMTMLAGVGLVALSIVLMLKVTAGVDPLGRQDLAFALAVILLGLLMMVTRRNAVSQVVGFMSLENGLILAASGARGMPLVVEISIAFSVLIAFIVIGLVSVSYSRALRQRRPV